MRLSTSTSSSADPAEMVQGSSSSRWPEVPVHPAGHEAELILPRGNRKHESPCPDMTFMMSVSLCLILAVQLQHIPTGTSCREHETAGKQKFTNLYTDLFLILN